MDIRYIHGCSQPTGVTQQIVEYGGIAPRLAESLALMRENWRPIGQVQHMVTDGHTACICRLIMPKREVEGWMSEDFCPDG